MEDGNAQQRQTMKVSFKTSAEQESFVNLPMINENKIECGFGHIQLNPHCLTLFEMSAFLMFDKTKVQTPCLIVRAWEN